MRNNLFAFPVGGDGNFAAVRAYVVVLYRNFGRVVAELVAPSVAYVHI